jgi:hypothetical protein
MLKRLLLSFLAVASFLGAAYAVNITGTTTLSTNSVDSVGFTQISVTNAITAFAGGGQTSAVLLNSAYNRVTVVATAADSVKLPFCGANSSPNGATLGIGAQVWVINADTTDALNVFPNTGDAINLLSANTAISVVNLNAKIFTCVAAANWQSINGTF